MELESKQIPQQKLTTLQTVRAFVIFVFAVALLLTTMTVVGKRIWAMRPVPITTTTISFTQAPPKPNKPQSSPSARFTYNLATDFVVSDGDTFRCTVDQGFGSIRPNQDVRVNGFDAWETTYIRKAQNIHITPKELELGQIAKAYLRTVLNQASAVHVVYDASDLDPYGRGLLWVFVDGHELGDLMRKAGHERYNLLPPPQVKYR